MPPLSELLQFFSTHWLLSGAFLVVLFITVMIELRDKKHASIQQISTNQTVQLSNRNQAQLLDIRSAQAFATGHIQNSQHIAEADIAKQLKQIQQFTANALVIISDRGIVKKQTLDVLEAAGVENIKVLQGGINAWREAHLPLTQPAKPEKQPKKRKKSDTTPHANNPAATDNPAETVNTPPTTETSTQESSMNHTQNQAKDHTTDLTSTDTTAAAPEIIVYSGDHCPYCTHAKKWLDQQQLKYQELRVDLNPDLREEMMQRCDGRRTIPQIIINGQAIGGYDDLMKLVHEKKIDTLLNK